MRQRLSRSGGLFGMKRKARGTTPQDGLPQDQVAALGYTAWPSSRAISMFATVDDNDPSHDDESPTIQMASLPGLARLAPNGLWLQTEKVETGCFKPELMGILKSVEKHYGQKVLVTSGHRDVAHNVAAGGAPQSRHITCEAGGYPGAWRHQSGAFLLSAHPARSRRRRHILSYAVCPRGCRPTARLELGLRRENLTRPCFDIAF